MTDEDYQIRVKELPGIERPREKLIKHGPDVLKNSELLAIILNTGCRGLNVLELSRMIIKDYGNKAIALEKNVGRLMEALNLPQVKACQVVATFELGRRFFLEDKGRIPTIKGPEDVFKHLSDMKKLQKEHFRGLYLNTRNRLIHDEIISMGTLNLSLIQPREVFRPAIEYSAAALILAHNHPSGDPEPSEDDIKVTRQIAEAGKLMEIDVLDHVIIGEERFVSLRERGVIE
jgi:DNA repair protein RadC